MDNKRKFSELISADIADISESYLASNNNSKNIPTNLERIIIDKIRKKNKNIFEI